MYQIILPSFKFSPDTSMDLTPSNDWLALQRHDQQCLASSKISLTLVNKSEDSTLCLYFHTCAMEALCFSAIDLTTSFSKRIGSSVQKNLSGRPGLPRQE